MSDNEKFKLVQSKKILHYNVVPSIKTLKRLTKLLLSLNSIIGAIKFSVFKSITDVNSAWEEIKNAVKSTPTMVFSVIGDSDSFVPRPWPKTVFQTALIEAGKSGGGKF